MPDPIVNPLRNDKINQQLEEATNAVKLYISNTEFADFAHQHLKKLQESIDQTTAALVDYKFKKERAPINFNETLEVLSNAITVLNEKHKIEQINAKKKGIYEDIENETTNALDIIEALVFLIEDVEEPREPPPIRPVDVKHDERLKRGRKVKKVIGEKFKDGKT